MDLNGIVDELKSLNEKDDNKVIIEQIDFYDFLD